MSYNSRKFYTLNFETGEIEKVFEGHSHWIQSLAFDPRGEIVASGSNDERTILWDFESGDNIRRMRCGYEVRSLCFSPDGEKLASGGGTPGGAGRGVDIWDVASGEKLCSLTIDYPETRGHTKSITQVSFSADGELLATGSHDGTVRIWDVDTGQELKILNVGSWIGSVLFSPDGKYLVAGADRIIFWDSSSLI